MYMCKKHTHLKHASLEMSGSLEKRLQGYLAHQKQHSHLGPP